MYNKQSSFTGFPQGIFSVCVCVCVGGGGGGGTIVKLIFLLFWTKRLKSFRGGKMA